MKDLSSTIQEALGTQLNTEGYDLVDLVPIPTLGDRMVRIRTVEEALEEFNASDEPQGASYLVHVRSKPREAAPQAQPVQAQQEDLVPADLYNNADLLVNAGEYALAKNILRALLRSGQLTAKALYGMGRCLEGEGKLEEAETHYRDSIAYEAHLAAYQRLSSVQIKSRNDAGAAETFERALRLKDLSSHVRFELHKASGNCWMRAQQNERAEVNYRHALDLNPSSDSVLANLGAVCLQAGKLSEAKRHFQDALIANPSNDKALTGLGSTALSEGDKRSAHDYFAKTLDIQINNPTAIYYLVKCAYELKSYAIAARIVESYVEVAPVNANLMYSLAGLQFHLGRVDEARTTAQKILQMQPQHPGATELLQIINKGRHAGTS